MSVHRPVHPLQGALGGPRDRRARRLAGAAAGRVLLEDLVHDRALVDDRAVPVVGVGREQLGDLRRGPGRRHQAALDLVVHVAAQVPRHRLEPGDGVRRRPVLDLVVGVLQPEHGVLQRDLRRRVPVQVGVHAVAVGLQVGERLRLEPGQLLLRDPAPPHRPDRLVRLEGGLAEHLREPARGGVPADVHLEEPVLGLHEPLRVEQVVAGPGVDLRDPVVVAEHLHRAVEPLQRQLAGGLRERLADHHDARDEGRDQDQDDHQDAVRRPAAPARPGPEAASRRRRRGGSGGRCGGVGHGGNCACSGPPVPPRPHAPRPGSL